MNKDKQEIVPELRFPEFEGEWDNKILQDLCFKISDGIHSTPKYDNTGEYYFVNGNNLINGKIVINESTKSVSKEEFKKHKRELGNNTILLSINGTIGNISEYNNEKVVLGKSACYINVDEDRVNKKFILFSLKTEGIRNYFYSELTGSTIKNLSLKTIKNTEIKLPYPKEQQKIANCLSSLDNLINAESEKLDYLKEHKKGLLQQLFPADGETKPKYRFPEFKKDGDWEEKKIDELGKTISGLRGKKGDDFGTGKPYVTYKQVFDSSYVKLKECKKVNISISENQNTLTKGDVLFTTSSETAYEVGFASVLIETPKEPVYLNSFCFALRPNNLKDLLPEFSRFLFHSKAYRKKVTLIAQGSTRFNLSKNAFIKLKLRLPNPKEQQKIADCLSSVDDLTTAQNQKIVALQEHKKGLMQQMFPNVNDLTL